MVQSVVVWVMVVVNGAVAEAGEGVGCVIVIVTGFVRVAVSLKERVGCVVSVTVPSSVTVRIDTVAVVVVVTAAADGLKVVVGWPRVTRELEMVREPHGPENVSVAVAVKALLVDWSVDAVQSAV